MSKLSDQNDGWNRTLWREVEVECDAHSEVADLQGLNDAY